MLLQSRTLFTRTTATALCPRFISGVTKGVVVGVTPVAFSVGKKVVYCSPALQYATRRTRGWYRSGGFWESEVGVRQSQQGARRLPILAEDLH